AGQPDQLEPFVGPRVLQGLQMLIHLAAVGRRIAKEPFQLVDRHRLVGTQQGRFKYSYYLCFCHQVAGRLSRLICIAGIIALIFCFPDAGWSSLAARRAHNPKVVGSNPAPATRIQDGPSAKALGPSSFGLCAARRLPKNTPSKNGPSSRAPSPSGPPKNAPWPHKP